MRVLVAGRTAKVLAKTAGAFANDLQIETAATKAASFALLERTEFDLIVACETLDDGSGLEVLSHVAVNAPNTLRIFAARPSTLNLLKGELGLFGLYRPLPYPINFRKLWARLSLARSTCADGRVRHVVLEEGWKPARTAPAAAPTAAAATSSTPVQQAARRPDTSGIRAAARYAAAHGEAAPARPTSRPQRQAASARKPAP